MIELHTLITPLIDEIDYTQDEKLSHYDPQAYEHYYQQARGIKEALRLNKSEQLIRYAKSADIWPCFAKHFAYHGDTRVRHAYLQHQCISADIESQILLHGQLSDKKALAANRQSSASILDLLADDAHHEISFVAMQNIASRPSLEAHDIRFLLRNADDIIALKVLQNPAIEKLEICEEFEQLLRRSTDIRRWVYFHPDYSSALHGFDYPQQDQQGVFAGKDHAALIKEARSAKFVFTALLGSISKQEFKFLSHHKQDVCAALAFIKRLREYQQFEPSITEHIYQAILAGSTSAEHKQQALRIFDNISAYEFAEFASFLPLNILLETLSNNSSEQGAAPRTILRYAMLSRFHKGNASYEETRQFIQHFFCDQRASFCLLEALCLDHNMMIAEIYKSVRLPVQKLSELAGRFNQRTMQQGEGYLINVPQTAYDLFTLGLAQEHCVGDQFYIDAAERGESIILYLLDVQNAYHNRANGSVYCQAGFTFEFDERHTLLQCYGHQNCEAPIQSRVYAEEFMAQFQNAGAR